MKEWIVKIEEETTLKQWFLSMHVAKNRINYLIDNHFCYVNGTYLKRESKLYKNDYLMIDLSNYEKKKEIPFDLSIDIVYEDDYILIINKPAGYIVYDESIEDSENKTVVGMVAQYYLSKQEESSVYPVHRLDKDTTGCLLFAKDVITLSYLSYLFETKEIDKEYFAVVEGNITKKGKIDLPIGRNRHRNNTMIVSKTGKPAITFYEPVVNKNNRTLVKVKLISGKTHQIRVHFSTIHHPLIGDLKYQGHIKNPRILLHCHQLAFVHPYIRKKMNYVVELPSDMKLL